MAAAACATREKEPVKHTKMPMKKSKEFVSAAKPSREMSDKKAGDSPPDKEKEKDKEGEKLSKEKDKEDGKERGKVSKEVEKEVEKEKEKDKEKEKLSKEKDKEMASKEKDKDGSTKERKASPKQEKSDASSSHEKKVKAKKERFEKIDKEVALYAARAERGAKKGKAERKNYFQALDDKWPFDRDEDKDEVEDEQGTNQQGSFRFGDVEVPKREDQYQTTIVGGGTTIGGATAIKEREDEDFTNMTVQEINRFLADERLVETRFEYEDKWDEVFAKFKRDPYKKAIDEYNRMEAIIGEDMMNVLCKTENLDGTTEMKYKDIPSEKPPPLKRVNDPAYELQWM